MGLIRETLFIFLAIIFFVTLLLTNLFLIVNWSLEPETLYPELQDIAKRTLENYDIIPQITSDFEMTEISCFEKESHTFNSGEYSLTIPCEIIKQGINATIDYGVENFINETYYKEYDCKILECLKTTNEPFVLISKKTKDYFNKKFKTTLIISIILLAILILISSKKHNALITSGILIALSALPFNEIKWLSSLFKDSIIFEFIGIFFTRAHNVFLIMLIIGVLVFLTGLGMRIFHYGIKISNWFKKKDKEITSELNEEKIKQDEESKKVTDSKKEEIKEIVSEEVGKLKNNPNKNILKKDNQEDNSQKNNPKEKKQI